MASNTALFLLIVTLSSVAAQTFQYSRGWTNGKRDGHKTVDEVHEMSTSLQRILSPCQIIKLKYLLEGKPFSERLFAPCDLIEDDDSQSKRYKERSLEPLFEAFQ